MSAAAVLDRVRRAQAQAQVDPYRACAVCDHGHTEGADRLCRAPGGRDGEPVHRARLATGACGPDARLMRVVRWGIT